MQPLDQALWSLHQRSLQSKMDVVCAVHGEHLGIIHNDSDDVIVRFKEVPAIARAYADDVPLGIYTKDMKFFAVNSSAYTLYVVFPRGYYLLFKAQPKVLIANIKRLQALNREYELNQMSIISYIIEDPARKLIELRKFFAVFGILVIWNDF